MYFNNQDQKEKMNSNLHSLNLENEKHKADLENLKLQMKLHDVYSSKILLF